MTDTDKRPELGTLALGQTVIVRRGHGRQTEYVRSVVVKIGRKLIDVEPEGDGYLFHFERRFRMDDQHAPGNSSHLASFRTEAQYAWDLRKQEADRYLRDQGLEISNYNPSPWKGRELELANVLRVHEGLEPL